MLSNCFTSVLVSRARLACTLLGLGLLGSTAGCDPPARQPATTKAAAPTPARGPAPAPGTSYVLDTLHIDQDAPNGLVVQVAYPRLRPQAGTGPADTVGIPAFNRAAQAFVAGLVKEMAQVARQNQRASLPTELQVSFQPYLLRPGLVSVAFTVDQDGIGPHPETWATGLTYDLRTGRKVLPADLFQQNAAFKKVVINTLKPLIASVEECQLAPDNLAWDNFSLGTDAYYLLLSDAQVGRACETRLVRVPLAKLQAFAKAGSPAARLR
jgi:hypothetical protein